MLDVGTGSGVIAIFCALSEARRVVAVDWNADAVANAVANVASLGLESRIEVRLSNVFTGIRAHDRFDVITANLPFMNKVANDVVESAIWDTDLYANRTFLNNASRFLSPGGRIYLTQANFGSVAVVLELARNAGYCIRTIGRQVVQKGSSVFYAFELKRK